MFTILYYTILYCTRHHIDHLLHILLIPFIVYYIVLQVADYGFGDRQDGVRFAVVNYHNTNGSFAGNVLNRVGTWVSGSGFTTCADDYITQSTLIGGCSNQVWGTPGNVQPGDRAEPLKQCHLQSRIS